MILQAADSGAESGLKKLRFLFLCSKNSICVVKPLKAKTPKVPIFGVFLAHLTGFEPVAYRLGAIGKPFILGHFYIILIGFTTIYTYLWGFFEFHYVSEK